MTRTGIWLALGIVVAGSLTAWAVWPARAPPSSADNQIRGEPPPPESPPPIPKPPPEPPIDVAAVRTRSWSAAAEILPAADREARDELNKAIKRLDAFFQSRRQGSRAFAEAILSLRGKWKYVQSKLPFAENEKHFRFLAAQFEEHVFSADELRHEVGAALAEYVSAVGAAENRLLVKLRADVAATEPLARRVLPELASDEAFRGAFDKLVALVAAEAARDAGVDLATFATWQVVGQGVMQEIATKVLAAVATRLAASAGIATTGAASGTVTFGLGVAVGIVLDIGFDWIMRQTGRDAATRVAGKVSQQVDAIGRWLVDGDPRAVQYYDTLRRLEDEHSDPQVRAESKAAADAIQASGNLGLRRSLMRVHNTRRQLREAALKEFFLGEPAVGAAN